MKRNRFLESLADVTIYLDADAPDAEVDPDELAEGDVTPSADPPGELETKS